MPVAFHHGWDHKRNHFDEGRNLFELAESVRLLRFRTAAEFPRLVSDDRVDRQSGSLRAAEASPAK